VLACSFFALLGFAPNTYAECKIVSIGFSAPHSFFLDSSDTDPTNDVPFYEGLGKQSSQKTVNIFTNNDSSCENKSVYVTIFSSTRKLDPDVPSSPDKPLRSIENKPYILVKTGQVLGTNAKHEYGLAASFYAAEENCFDYNSTNLKAMIQNSIAAGTSKQSDYGDLNTPSTQILYDYLFGGYNLETFTSNDLWSIKKTVYRKFNKSVDCGYYARAQLDTQMNVKTLSNDKGEPVAQITDADYQKNYIGFMCDYSAGIFCNTEKRWEKRGAKEVSAGSIDANDKCSVNGVTAPGCYELLAPIPGLGNDQGTINFDSVDGKPAFALEEFFTAGINVVIGAVSVMAVLALIYYGFKMMSDRSAGNVSGIKVNKERIMNVFWGIGIILGSYVILNTINPDLLVIAPSLGEVNLNAEQVKNVKDAGIPFTYDGILPSPEDYKIVAISFSGNRKYIKDPYLVDMNKVFPTTPKGIKTLIAAHTYMEGFYPGTKAWRTNNPGNIGNTDDGATRSFASLPEGIKAQYDHYTKTVLGAQKGGRYYIGGRIKNDAGQSDLPDGKGGRLPYPAVDFVYDGSLYQYLRIYATAGRMSNQYLSFMISFFKAEGIIITPYTKMSEIAGMN